MANANQVIVNGETILDLRSDTVTPETLQKGYTAHDKSGTKITGTLEASSVSVQPTKSVTITSNGTVSVTPDLPYDALKKIDVTVDVASGGGGAPYTLTLAGSPNFFDKLIFIDSSLNHTTLTGVSFPYVVEMYSPNFALGLNSMTSAAVPTFTDCGDDSFFGFNGLINSNFIFRSCTIKTPNSAVLTFPSSCFTPDTLITLADGAKRQIKDLTYDDTLLVWNFDKGKFDSASICWLTRSGMINDHYYKLTFSDGTVLKTTGQNSNHKIYNVDERFFKGVDKTKIGDRIFSENGIVTVVDKEYIEEEVEYYNLITTETINCFAEGILTSDRYGNLYPIDENMMYVRDGRYRPYEEFEAVGIKRYWYDTLRLAEVSGTIEETQKYIAKLECQMLPLSEDNT